jgi:acetoin utilization protein AcuB
MLIKDYMTRHPIMISPETSAGEAQQIMTDNQIRHLPVVGDGKRILGLISMVRLRIPPTDLASLNVWEISRFLSELKAKDVMVKKADLICTNQDSTMEEAAQLMIDNKVGCLLVLEDDIVVGIITEIDMMAQLNDLLGGGFTGVRVTMRMPDKKGELVKLTSAVADLGGGIYASGSMQSPKVPDHWDIVIKVRNVPKDILVDALEKISSQEIIDVR